MELEQAMQWFNTFTGVAITLESIIFIVNGILELIDNKYYKVDLKKYISLSDDVIEAINTPVSIILGAWLIVSLGVAFIK